MATTAASSTAPSLPAETNGGEQGDRGILFSQPTFLGSSSFRTVAVLAENTTDLVKSYTVKATYKDGETITATATGVVNDHLPGATRVASLLLDGTPGQGDTVRIDVDTMVIEAETTESADIARQLQFGRPTFSGGSFPTIEVEVTNNASQQASMTVSAAILRDGVLVGRASGVVNDLAPGQTKTASLLVDGLARDDDQLILAADTLFVTD